jgi:predicted nucleic acid-binding protein
MRCLLDTSAVVAWLNDELGAERVRQILTSDGETFLPWPVLFEILYLSERASGEQKALQRYATIKQLPVTFLLDVDEPLILLAARVKARYSVSQSDALIAAYALANDAVLVHKDPEYAALATVLNQEALPFKKVDPTS